MTWPPDSTEWLLTGAAAWLLTAARAFGLAWTAPGWGTPVLGWRLRVGLAIALASVVGPTVGSGLALPGDAADPAAGLAWLRLVAAGAVEMTVGAGIGLGAALVVAGARQAGELIGLQAGLTPAAILDPETLADGAGLTPMGHLYGLIALAMFLALDGPLTVVDALAESYRVVPVGGGLIAPTAPAGSAAAAPAPAEVTAARAAARWAFGRVGRALELAVRVAAPVALALILAGLALALLTRTAPASPLSGLAWPVRSMLGLALTWLGLAALCGTLAVAWSEWAAHLWRT